MDRRWAASGARAEFSMPLTWQADGTATVGDVRPVRGLALGSGATWTVNNATWTRPRGGLKVQLEHDGFAVGDVILEPGTLDLAISAVKLPTNVTLIKRDGIATIIAYRWFVRKERRIVGTWYATPLK